MDQNDQEPTTTTIEVSRDTLAELESWMGEGAHRMDHGTAIAALLTLARARDGRISGRIVLDTAGRLTVSSASSAQ